MRKRPNHSIKEAQLVTFINKIIRNTATNYYNKESRRLSREFLEEPEKMKLILTNEQSHRINTQKLIEKSGSIGRGMDKLTDDDWKLLRMKYELKMTDADIAKEFHISRQAINHRKNLLLNKLRGA